MGSNERKCFREGLGSKKWAVVSNIVDGFLLVVKNIKEEIRLASSLSYLQAISITGPVV